METSNHYLQDIIPFEKEKLVETLHGFHDGLVVVDEEGIIILWNKAMEDASGLTAETIINQHVWDVHYKLLPEQEQTDERYLMLKKGMENFLSTGQSEWANRPFEQEFHKPDGEAVFFSLTTTSIKTLKGHILVQMAQDITDRKKAENAIKRYTFQIETLRQLGLELASELGFDTLLWMIAPRAIELLDGTAMALYICNTETNLLELAICLGDSQPPIEQQVRRGEGLAGQIWETCQPILLEDYRTGNTGILTRSTWGKVAGTPIMYGGEFLGVIFVYSTEPFNTSDLSLLGLFASHAGAAIRNARLHAELHEMAIRDPLTGIFNRRHFFELAEKNFMYAQRYKRPLSAIVFDLDYYKRVNDELGHVAGDVVLHEVAVQCLAEMRQLDIFGRYGGEEFVVLMPETDLKGAVTLAERLRKRIENQLFHTERGDAKVTISLGVAKLKKSYTSLNMLIDEADRALYRAKNAGRNCVST